MFSTETVDFHTHILPAIDDGAKTVEDSLRLINFVSSLNVSQIVLSPHYYPTQESVEEFIEKRNKSCQILADALAKKQQNEEKKLPTFHLGCEVYLEPIIFNNEDLTPLTLNTSGNFMLTELFYESEFTHSTETMIRQLFYSYNIVPILAHIDRYPFLLKEKNLYKLLEMGCVAQINVSSLSNFFIRKKLIKYIEKGYIGAFGTDIHSTNNIQKMKKGISYLKPDHIEYITDVSTGILNKSKKESAITGTQIDNIFAD